MKVSREGAKRRLCHQAEGVPGIFGRRRETWGSRGACGRLETNTRALLPEERCLSKMHPSLLEHSPYLSTEQTQESPSFPAGRSVACSLSVRIGLYFRDNSLLFSSLQQQRPWRSLITPYPSAPSYGVQRELRGSDSIQTLEQIGPFEEMRWGGGVHHRFPLSSPKPCLPEIEVVYE